MDNYYNGFALTYAFGIFVYMSKSKIKERIGFIPFVFANATLSIVWFIVVPLTLILSFKDAFNGKKA